MPLAPDGLRNECLYCGCHRNYGADRQRGSEPPTKAPYPSPYSTMGPGPSVADAQGPVAAPASFTPICGWPGPSLTASLGRHPSLSLLVRSDLQFLSLQTSVPSQFLSLLAASATCKDKVTEARLLTLCPFLGFWLFTFWLPGSSAPAGKCLTLSGMAQWMAGTLHRESPSLWLCHVAKACCAVEIRTMTSHSSLGLLSGTKR